VSIRVSTANRLKDAYIALALLAVGLAITYRTQLTIGAAAAETFPT
jgi:hypothetical protein